MIGIFPGNTALILITLYQLLLSSMMGDTVVCRCGAGSCIILLWKSIRISCILLGLAEIWMGMSIRLGMVLEAVGAVGISSGIFLLCCEVVIVKVVSVIIGYRRY